MTFSSADGCQRDDSSAHDRQRARLLLFTGALPVPLINGDRIANFGLLKALSQRFACTLVTRMEVDTTTASFVPEHICALGVDVLFAGAGDHRKGPGARLGRVAKALTQDAPLRFVSRLIPHVEPYLFNLAATKRAQAVVHLDNYRIMYVGLLPMTEIMHVHNVDGWSAALRSPLVGLPRKTKRGGAPDPTHGAAGVPFLGSGDDHIGRGSSSTGDTLRPQGRCELCRLGSTWAGTVPVTISRELYLGGAASSVTDRTSWAFIASYLRFGQ